MNENKNGTVSHRKPNGERYKILVVDDEVDITACLQSILSRRGYLVNTTTNGRDALVMIKALKPDLVLLDFNLPEMDGREVLRELRKEKNETKVIFVTGHTLLKAEDKREIYSLGICEYLRKPVVLDDMLSLIQGALGGVDSKRISPEKSADEIKAEKESSITHKLSNLLGIIRNKCETYCLNVKDGLYQEKTREEILDISVRVMSNSMTTIDEAMKVIDKIKQETYPHEKD